MKSTSRIVIFLLGWLEFTVSDLEKFVVSLKKIGVPALSDCHTSSLCCFGQTIFTI